MYNHSLLKQWVSRRRSSHSDITVSVFARRGGSRDVRWGLRILLLVASVALVLAGCASSNSGSTNPAITGLVPTSGAVGTAVTITGNNFGATQGASTVAFNGTAAAAASAWSATSITVMVPAGATTGNVIVTVSGVASNGASFVVPAIITSLSASSGAVGTQITITGSNFGATQGSSTVTFNGAAAAAASAWSATSITVTVPGGATTGNVVVTVSGVASNGSPFTIAPGITSLSQTSGAVGVSITITGTNFGAAQGASTVTFNGAAAAAASAWSATSITVTVPAGATTGNVVVTVLGSPSNGSPFTIVLPPAITSLNQTSGAIGVSVIITGTNFGAAQGTSTVTFNGTAATTITAWSASSITAKVPAGASTGNVVVTVLGSPSNGSPFTVIPAPTITSLNQTSGAVGVSITITGTNFGAAQGSSTVTFNGTGATPTLWSATSITATVPAGATTGNVVVTVLGSPSNGSPFTVIPAPTITSLNQTSGAVGVSITITGTNFGAAQGSSTVTFNGIAATTVTAWSATSITAAVPTGATTGNVVVTVFGSASNGSSFTVIPAPAITSLSQTSGAVGTAITITGTNFGASQGASTVTFNGTAAAAASAWSATSITVLVPAGATTGNVVVTVLGAASNSSPFTVAPTITSLSQTSGAIGVSITITGTNFGATQSTSTVTFNGTAAAAASAWSATSITVLVPAGATSGNVVVTVAGAASNGSPFTVILPPAITSLSAPSGAVGTAITITGTSFGATQSSSTVTFNGTAATSVTLWSATSITINVPSGATTGNVVVTVAGTPSNGSPFTVAPTITSLSQTSGAIGVSITITGTNFGATQSTSTVTFNGTAAAAASSWSATSITVTVPAGATTGNVVVTVGGLLSNGSSFTVVLPPSLTSLSQTSGPIGTSITITGTNFGASQGTSTVTFNGTAATTVTAWSATSITATVPSGATTGNVIVTVLGSVSNGSLFTITASCTNNCQISGTITGPWTQFVTISLSGGPSSPSPTQTAADGTYTFTGLTSGSYSVSAVLPGYTFTPSISNPVNVTSNTEVDFTEARVVTTYTIGGTITYGGSATGTTMIHVYDANCTGCGAIVGGAVPPTVSSTGTAYFLRGLPPGMYVVSAEIDTQGTGTLNSSNPIGNSTTVTITSSSATNVNFTISDRPSPPAPSTPSQPQVFPSSSAVLVSYSAVSDNNNDEMATSYLLSYGTDTNASNLGTVSIPAGNPQNVFALTSTVTNGTAYYFKLAAKNASATSAYSPVYGPVTVGATTGLNTVSGTVSFPGITPTGRLNVGLFSNTTGVYFASYTSPTSGQAFSVSGVPSGSYYLFAFLDQQNCNSICIGDISNFTTQNGPPQITVSGNSSGNSITLTAADALAFVTTNHQRQGSTDSYNVQVAVSGMAKLPRGVVLYSAPNVGVPFSMYADSQQNYNPVFNNSAAPSVGDTYEFQVGFTGSPNEIIPVSIAEVLSYPTQFAQSLAMNTGVPFSRTVPQLTWAAPSSPPAGGYSYQVNVSVASNGNFVWNYSGGHNSNGIPSTQTSIVFNSDGSASQSSLTSGTTYNWSVTVSDASGNSSTFVTTYTP